MQKQAIGIFQFEIEFSHEFIEFFESVLTEWLV